jgi:hypothetical protein
MSSIQHYLSFRLKLYKMFEEMKGVITYTSDGRQVIDL